jgi:hypothetical protein
MIEERSIRRTGRPQRNFRINHLNAAECRQLAIHAGRRGSDAEGAEVLIRQIVSIVLRDNLIDAVLDNGQALANRTNAEI